MKQNLTTLTISTRGQGLYDISDQLNAWLRDCAIATGVMTVFCRHTSASLTIQENADPDVLADLQDFFKQAVREDPTLYRHSNEGLDDMPAHIRTTLTDVSLSIPVADGRLALGMWQSVFLFEHRARGSNREVVVQVMGE